MTLSANQSIGYLKQVYPTSGAVYGWLSDFAHWLPDHHQLFVSFDGNRYSYTKASAEFRAVSLAHILLLLDICFAVFDRLPPDGKTKIAFSAARKFKKRRVTKKWILEIHKVTEGRFQTLIPVHLIP